jgi:hypothetical protein
MHIKVWIPPPNPLPGPHRWAGHTFLFYVVTQKANWRDVASRIKYLRHQAGTMAQRTTFVQTTFNVWCGGFQTRPIMCTAQVPCSFTPTTVFPNSLAKQQTKSQSISNLLLRPWTPRLPVVSTIRIRVAIHNLFWMKIRPIGSKWLRNDQALINSTLWSPQP